jgi:hypothetical protein
VGKINAKRLEWFGHIQRMDEHRITRKITNCTPTLLKWPKGRAKGRWMDSGTGRFEDYGCTGLKKLQKSQ